ncbi:uncharacterized protein LOC115225702 [Argonauta hians]
MPTMWIYIGIVLVYHSCLGGYCSEDVWNYCTKTVCGNSMNLRCSPGTTILIYNAQRATDLRFLERSFQEFRISCMGRQRCRLTSICHLTRIKVSYTCVKDDQIMKACRKDLVLSEAQGFLQNDRYPSMTMIGGCKWTIEVPHGAFIVLRVHDVMLSGQGRTRRCQSGLHLETEQICSGSDFSPTTTTTTKTPSVTPTPGGTRELLLCSNTEGFEPRHIVACGRVVVRLLNVQEMNQFRFWLSYEVKPLTKQNLSYLFNQNLSCLDDAKVNFDKWTFPKVSRPQGSYNHLYTTTPLSNTTAPDNQNGTLNSNNKMKRSFISSNLTLVLVIAAPLLAVALLASIGICYWRGKTKKKKSGGPVLAKDAAVQTPISRHVESVRHGQQYSDNNKYHHHHHHHHHLHRHHHHPAIQEGYSHVADEVPFPEAAKMIDAAVGTTEAYAEVDDGCGCVYGGQTVNKPQPARFRFNIGRSLPALPGRKPPPPPPPSTTTSSTMYSDDWAPGGKSRGSSNRASVGSQSDYYYQKAIYEEIPDYYVCRNNNSDNNSGSNNNNNNNDNNNPSNYNSSRDSEPSSVETDSGIESEDKIARSRLAQKSQNSSIVVTQPSPHNIPAIHKPNSISKPSSSSSTSSSSSSSPSASSHHHKPSPLPALNLRGEPTACDAATPKYHVIERTNPSRNNTEDTSCSGDSIVRPGDEGLVLLHNEECEPYYEQTE